MDRILLNLKCPQNLVLTPDCPNMAPGLRIRAVIKIHSPSRHHDEVLNYALGEILPLSVLTRNATQLLWFRSVFDISLYRLDLWIILSNSLVCYFYFGQG
jgi:hypothetical protein